MGVFKNGSVHQRYVFLSLFHKILKITNHTSGIILGVKISKQILFNFLDVLP
jgi:hypothetical protein